LIYASKSNFWVNLMTEPIKLLVLFGGRSGEHAVSLMSARSVLDSADKKRYQVLQVGITQEGRWLTGENALAAFESGRQAELSDAVVLNENGSAALFSRDGEKLHKVSKIDVVFPVLHGSFGEDGTMQGLLEVLDLAYVGAGVLGSSAAMDKAVTKHIVGADGTPVLDFKVFNRSEIHTDIAKVAEESEKIAAYPLFVKPANLGSSVGITKAKNHAELLEGLALAARYDRRVLVERGIPAREIEVSVLGNDNPIVSLPGEIFPGAEFYTYTDKYYSGDPELAIPAELTDVQTAMIQANAIKAYRALDCAGMARVDFLMDKNTNQIYFNEVNTIPGFTRISMYSKLWTASGMEYSQLIDKLIDLALERKADKDQTLRRYEA